MKLGYRLIDAGAEIIAMYAGRPRQDCRDLMYAVTFRALAAEGFREMPGDETPLDLRYQLVRRAAEMTGDELAKWGVSPQNRARVVEELLAFYRGVRGIDDDAGPA